MLKMSRHTTVTDRLARHKLQLQIGSDYKSTVKLLEPIPEFKQNRRPRHAFMIPVIYV